MPPPNRLEEALLRLTQQQLHLTSKIDELLTHVTPAFSPTPPPPPFPPRHPAPAPNHKMKLEVPRFDGTDPLGWIFKINRFFEYHGTSDHDRLTIAGSTWKEGPLLGSNG